MGLSKMHMAFVRESGFLGRKNEKIYLPNNQGKVTLALVGKSSDHREMGAVISKLASNIYKITNFYECGPEKVLTGLVKKRFRDIEISSLSDYDVLNNLKDS